MILAQVYDMLQEAVSTLTQGHPWMALGVAVGAIITWKFINRPRNLPPGPFNLPFIGAVSFIREDMYVKLLEVRPIYGDVIYLKMLGNQMVILNSEKVIREAYIRRGEEFSHRQKSGFARAIGLSGDEIFSAPYNAKWKTNKKFAVTAFKSFGFGSAKSETKIYRALEKLDAVLLAKKGQAIELKEHLKAYSASLIFAIFFNQDRPLTDQQFSRISAMVTEWFAGFTGGIMMYDSFLPDIQLIKNLVCRQALKKGRRATSALIDELKVMIKEHRAKFDSSQINDVIDYYIAQRKDLVDEDIAKNLLVTLPDGIDTASLLLVWLIFYLCKHQHVQKNLQEQIDEKLGLDRNPTLADKPLLPYGEAIILEMLRCSDVIPITGPRKLQKDTEFCGYMIPKEAGVIACFHSVHYDPDVFPDPSHFDPSRFLDADGNLDRVQASHVIPFSIGPRSCMGEIHTKAQLFLTLIHLAQKFNMKFDPNEPEPSDCHDPSLGIFRSPVPYKVCFTPR